MKPSILFILQISFKNFSKKISLYEAKNYSLKTGIGFISGLPICKNNVHSASYNLNLTLPYTHTEIIP